MVRSSASADRVSRQGIARAAVLAAAAIVATACAPLGRGGKDAPLALRWTGRGTVYPGGKPLALGVATEVTPFLHARSETWPLAQGRTASRTMTIAPDGGWIERGGRREPMPAAMLRHERQQFALYGQMQIALRRAAAAPASSGEQRIVVPGDGEGSVSTEFTLRAGRLVEARNSVDDPEGPGRPIAQLIRFGGEPLVSQGLHWPGRLEILHAGLPWFTLELEAFAAPPAGAR